MFNLSEVTSVADAQAAIETAKGKRAEYLYRKSREEANIKESEMPLSDLSGRLYEMDMEILGYESQLQSVPELPNSKAIEGYLKITRVKRAKILLEMEDMGIAKTQHRRLLVACEDIYINVADTFIAELEARIVEINNAA